MLRIAADYEKVSVMGRTLIDLVHLVRLFAEGCKKPKVAYFRPLAAVLDEPAVQKLQAA
jgi:hypothetical protein